MPPDEIRRFDGMYNNFHGSTYLGVRLCIAKFYLHPRIFYLVCIVPSVAVMNFFLKFLQIFDIVNRKDPEPKLDPDT